jgi:hypothetical protein
MLKSIREISAIAGTNRETVEKRANQLGLIPKDGDKGAKLYDTRAILQLVPCPTRGSEGAETKEEAQIRQILADAKLKELQSQKLEGDLAPVSEILTLQNSIFDSIAAIIKKSSLPEDDKADILENISSAARNWAEP